MYFNIARHLPRCSDLIGQWASEKCVPDVTPVRDRGCSQGCLAFVAELRIFLTAWPMASRSMPNSLSSSSGFPLQGTWPTASRCTVISGSLTTAEHTASPRPPAESHENQKHLPFKLWKVWNEYLIMNENCAAGKSVKILWTVRLLKHLIFIMTFLCRQTQHKCIMGTK